MTLNRLVYSKILESVATLRALAVRTVTPAIITDPAVAPADSILATVFMSCSERRSSQSKTFPPVLTVA